MIPLTSTKAYFLEIPFGKFAVTVVSLPFFSFIFCVIWSVLYFFEKSTSTHCGVPNYLPSISASIGNYQPQRFIWQCAILLQALPRLLIAHQYLRHNSSRIRRSRRALAYLAFLLNIIENIALVGLSLWNSSEFYEIHKYCFIIFIATSECYMLISYILCRHSRKMLDTISSVERKSLYFKRIFLFVNIVSSWFVGYFFIRHNSYCEPRVYTLFALMEYVFVLTNMAFHMTAYWDFNDKIIVFDRINGFDTIQSFEMRTKTASTYALASLSILKIKKIKELNVD